MREQLGATRDAARELVEAHIELARAEAAEIADEGKRMAGLGAVAVGFIFGAALLAFIGVFLWLGEWLFGSIGWGVLIGTLLLIALAVSLAAAAVRVSGRRIGTAIGLALLVGILVAVVLAGNLLNQAWTLLGNSVAPNIDPAYRPLLVAVAVVAVIGLVLALVAVVVRRIRGSAAFGMLVVGLLAGAGIGALTAISPGFQAGLALAITAMLIAWPAILGSDIARTGIDVEGLKARFTPTATIETTKETIEWLQARMRRSPGS
jgi:hypothetical protein